jgi:uncharacterized protein (TIGR02452 family)
MAPNLSISKAISRMSSPQQKKKEKVASPEKPAPQHDSPRTMIAAKQKVESVDLRYALDPVGGGVDRKTTSKMTFSRTWLVHLANETVEIGQLGYYTNTQGEKVDISDALNYAKENSVHYHCSHIFDTQSPPVLANNTKPQLFDTKYKICYGSSLNVATELYQANPERELQIGILNSASSKNPGGKFFRGTIAQEDCICRASLLYHCLLQYIHDEHHFYFVNNKPKYQISSSSCAIFSPRVPVIRHDTLRGEILDQYYQFSFVSIPAPNAFVLGREEEESESGTAPSKDVPEAQTLGAVERGETYEHNMTLNAALRDPNAFVLGREEEESESGSNPSKVVPEAQAPGAVERGEAYEHMTLNAALRDRCLRALSIFAEQNITELVLCAFGCGVHGNRPKDVAACFRDILNTELKGRFRTVAFAILSSIPMNYDAFCDAFPEAERS